MINLTELTELKGAHKAGLVEELIKKWEIELFNAERKKAGKVVFTLKAFNGPNEREVIGSKLVEGIAYHKDAWGENFYVLTHIHTGVKIMAGKKKPFMAAVKELASLPILETIKSKLDEFGMDAIKHMSQEEITEYRRVYNIANGAR